MNGFYTALAGIIALAPSAILAADIVEPPKPFGPSNWDWTSILYTVLVTLLVFFFGIILFNKTEKSFIDTI